MLSACGIKAQLKQADKKYAIGEYYEAGEMYKQIYKRLPAKKERRLKAYAAYQQGECYRILDNERAYACYQNAIRNKYQDSLVYLRYAETLHYGGKYAEAEKQYSIYLESHPDSYVAKAGLYACRMMAEWKKSPSRYKVTLAKDLNDRRGATFAPMFIGQEGSAIMFTSNRQVSGSNKKKLKRPNPITGMQNAALYQTRRNTAGKWEDITLAEGLYDNASESESDSTSTTQAGQAEMGVCCFSADGKTLYFTYTCPKTGQDQGAKIYVSNRASGEWSEPQELKIFNDSSITVAHPALCPTGDTLYFVSDAPGGQGGKDIWMVELDGSEWVNPQNMGPQINTELDEMFPTVHPNGTLYFASNGHPGYGGLDIYYVLRDTVLQDSLSLPYQVWNMGAPVNSAWDDFGITFESNSQNGLFSSNRNQRKALDQLYYFTLPEMEFLVTGNVQDQMGEQISDAMIRIIGDDGTNTRLNVRRDGTYKVKINRDVHYVMLCTARGYLNSKELFQTLNLQDSKTYEINFALSPISRPVQMDNVFYEFGSYQLTSESETALLQLVKLLEDNPNITIELSAHTDMVGDEAHNNTLSKQRAESCVKFLIQHGIEKERLTAVGYGKSKPVVADKHLHDRYKFIPLDQELNEAFILSLTKEQQEICNQINRRTEFKVLKTTYKLY